ncbi:MAG: hypothetical protein ACU85U_16705 [Gammaproteobacteria bacterium]|jgi:hypothetical protein
MFAATLPCCDDRGRDAALGPLPPQRSTDRRLAVRTELPLLALIVCYTLSSLWILAQPMFA